MEVPDPEIPGTEDDIQKDKIQKVLNKLQHHVLCFNNIFISILIAICGILLMFIVLICY